MTANRPSIFPPSGLSYLPEFLSPAEEQELLEPIVRMPMAPFQMRGVISKRLVMHFGWDYHYDAWEIMPTTPLPDFLVALRAKAAAAVGARPREFEEALINGYPPRAGIGWHRDAPMFGSPVIGISLGSPARMRFRRKTTWGYDLYNQILQPRSLYAMDGESRHLWQHMIPSTSPEARWSITFRKVIRKPAVSLAQEGSAI